MGLTYTYFRAIIFCLFHIYALDNICTNPITDVKINFSTYHAFIFGKKHGGQLSRTNKLNEFWMSFGAELKGDIIFSLFLSTSNKQDIAKKIERKKVKMEKGMNIQQGDIFYSSDIFIFFKSLLFMWHIQWNNHKKLN